MRLITLTAVVCLALATVIGALTNLTYSVAPTSMCLRLHTEPSNFQLDIHTDSDFLLRRQAAVLEQRRSVDITQESPDKRFVASVIGTVRSQQLRIYDRQTGNNQILTQGIDITFVWSEDSRSLTYEQLSIELTESGYHYYWYGLATFSERRDIANYTFTFEQFQSAHWLPNSRGLAYIKHDLLYIWTLDQRKWASVTLPRVGNVANRMFFYQTARADQLIMMYWADKTFDPVLVVLSLSDLSSRELQLKGNLLPNSNVALILPSKPQTTLMVAIYQTQDRNWHHALVDSARAQVIHTVDYDNRLPFNLPLWSEYGDTLYTFTPEADGRHLLLRGYNPLTNVLSEPIIRNISLPSDTENYTPTIAISQLYQELVAITEHHGRYDLILLKLSDGTITTLLKDKRHISSPQWSPNQQQLIAVWTDDNGSGVVAQNVQMDTTSNTPLDVQLGVSYFESPSSMIWLADGEVDRVVMSFQSTNMSIAVNSPLLLQLLDLSSGNVIPLSKDQNQLDRWFGQLTHNHTFWVESVLPDQHFTLAQYDANGKLLTNFIGPESGAWSYQLSSNGKRLLVSYFTAAYLLASQAGSALKLNITQPYILAWSPDSSQFALADPQTVSIFAADGTLRHQLHVPSVLRGLAWSACQ